MKKYLALIVSVVFVLGFAASALAVPAEIPADTQAIVAKGTTQVTLGGEIRARGEWRANVSSFDKTKTGSSESYYDMRVRLSVEAKVTPNTIGFVEVQSGNADNADNVTQGAYYDRSGNLIAGGAKGIYQYGNANMGDVRIRQAWILHKGSGLLGVPALVKVGRMPIKIGTGQFFDHTYWGDYAILFGVDPVKDMSIILGTLKFAENSLGKSDDADAYALLFNYAFDKKSAISADVTYVNHQNSLLAPIGTTNGLSAHLFNFGLRGNTEVSGLGLKAEFNFQSGKIKNIVPADIKFRGMQASAGVYYKVNPVTLSLDFAYGSGDNNGTDDKYKAFVTTQGNEQHYTYVYEYRTVSAAGVQYSNLTNTWYLKLGAKADIVKNVNADLGLYILRAVKENPVGPTGAKVFAYTNDSKDIGTEFDAKITYKIDKNLNYWVEGGYLFAGNFWHAVTGPTKKPDDAYAVRHGISVSF